MSELFPVDRNPNPVAPAIRDAVLADPGFGRYFTDHMVQIKWNEDRQWHDAEVVPYGPIAMDPATNSLHYGQSIFEGLKAYRRDDDEIVTFRGDRNAARFRRSAARLAMPKLPDEYFLGAIDALLEVDGDWVPGGEDRSLYLRPFLFSTEVGLGVRPANEYLFLLIASPAGPYFPQGIKPVSVWLCEDYVRAAPGGTGEAKCAGNYAASLVAQAEAIEHGCDQVVWLDAAEHKYVEEMGGMNLFFVYGSGDSARLLTPALTGSLLPGVTRDALLQLASDLGYQVEEGQISVDDWRGGCESGDLTEVFACGTAAVITPVGSVKAESGSWTIADGEAGPITMQLREQLTGIQRGSVEDKHGWIHKIN